jgi:esterase/lipase
MELIYASLGSQEKHTLVIDRSNHVITRDAQRELVFQAVADFVASHLQPITTHEP